MSLALLVGLITAAGAALSFRAPTEQELIASFTEAQRFYAEGAYDQAIDQYRAVSAVRSRVLDAQTIQVSVGEELYPVQEAALYQMGNAYNKRFADYTNFSRNDQSRESEYLVLADSSYRQSVHSFERVINTATSEELKGLAHGRLIETHFEAQNFEDVVDASQRLIDDYGTGEYALPGFYNLGWAHYEMGDFKSSIDAFVDLVEKYPNGYRTDRSLFQIGESYLAMDDCSSAVKYYQQLVERQRIDELSEEQLASMQREKLAGLVDETALELAAKAEIRTATCYGKIGDYEAGVASFRRVITRFASERKLVEEAYLRLADMYEQRGDFDESVRTYREAIDISSDRSLRARIQFALAEKLFSKEAYTDALSEFRVYLQGYGDIARNVGFPTDRVHYRMGNSYQQLAQVHLERGEQAAAGPHLERAVAYYDTILQRPDTPYKWESQFNRAYALQSMGDVASEERAERAYQALVEEADESYVRRSLLQLSELSFKRGDYGLSDSLANQVLVLFPEAEGLDNAHMRRALALQSLERYEDSTNEFLQVAEDSPHYASSRLGAGHQLLEQGQYDRALGVLDEGVHSADAKQVQSFLYLMAQAHSGQANWSEAVRVYSELIEAEPEGDLRVASHLARANAALSNSELALAESDLTWVLQSVSDPEKVRYARETLTLLYLKENRSSEAVGLLESMSQDEAEPARKAELLSRIMDSYYAEGLLQETANTARQILAVEFDDQPRADRPYGLKEKALFILGEILVRSADNSDGVATLQAYVQQFPTGRFIVNAQLSLATIAFSEGDLEQAKRQLVEVENAELTSEQRFLVMYYLANTHYSLREFKAARALFEEMIASYPESESADALYFGLGESSYQLGLFEEAIAAYSTLLKDFTSSENADDALYNMAWCLIELERQEEAMAQFALLLERYPESEFAASAQFTFGDYAYNAGQYKEALKAYSIVEQRYQASAVAQQVPKLKKELREAIAYEAYEKGLALMDSAEVGNRAEFYEEAINVFTGIVEEYEGTESALGALSNMGVCLEGVGKWNEAVRVYDQVIEMYEKEEATRDAYQFARSHRDWIIASRL